MTETTAEPQVEQEEQQTKPSELTINDLAALRSIIDIASTRGAFKPVEFETIGRVYSSLNNFLMAVSQQNAEPSEEQPTDEQGAE